MHIRPASLTDLERCQNLDASYVTDTVWRMEERIAEDNASVTFRRVQIPRQMDVPYPCRLDELREDWQRKECFLVADDMGRAVGFLDMVVQRWRWHGSIEHLIVDRGYRGRGIGSRLLLAAGRWARGSQLRSMGIVLQSKNGPALDLFMRRGYRFHGFIDDYYENGDIGMVLTLHL